MEANFDAEKNDLERAMKNLKARFTAVILATLSFRPGKSRPAPTPTPIHPIRPRTTGANVLLYVDGATEISYIQFNLSSIPSEATLAKLC